MPRYELVHADEDETLEYESAKRFSGLMYEDAYKHLGDSRLARLEYDASFIGRTAPGSRTDHRHLSMATGPRKKLVRWSARSSSGFHHGYGAVMRIVRVS